LVHLIRRVCRCRRHDDGAVAVLVAMLSVVLFGFGALVIDIGHAQVVRSQGQNAVDAASLAGVRVLADESSAPNVLADVLATVQSYVKDNMGITDWAGCTDPTPLAVLVDTDSTDTCISMSTPPPASGITSYQVRVKLPTQHVPATFGGLFGVSSIGISPVAQALSGQPLPPECGPCDPVLDESTGQPTPQPPPTGLPAAIRAMLPPPDPAVVPPAEPVDDHGCPTTPGLYEQPDFPPVVTVGVGPDAVACTLHSGLYVFNDVSLDVAAIGSLASALTGRPQNPGDPPQGTGVTLIFYGSATLTVEGHIGTRPPVGAGPRLPLIASDPAVVWQTGQPIPGVAIVLDQFGSATSVPATSICNGVPSTRCFSLGDDLTITGSVYALDGQTTWATATGDCAPVTSACVVHDFSNGPSVLATTTTAFAPDPDGTDRIPTVATDHPMAEPPPSPPHLVK